MKLNIADPTTGGQKIFDIEDDKKLRIFYDQRIAAEVDATPLGDAFKGYVLRITGGSDLQGFPMKQGVLVNGRVRLLLKGKTLGFRRPLHDGERRRKSVRGCIVGPDLAVLNLIVAKKGEAELPGVTDKLIPNRVGPKRASKIRKLFNLTKDDDVRQFIKKKERVDKKDPSKKHTKTPKIQRLVTSQRLQHKRRLHSLHMKKLLKAKTDRAAYNKLMLDRAEQAQKKKVQLAEKKKSARRTHRLQAIKKAIEKRRNAKIQLKLTHKRIAELRLKRREALKAAGKSVQKTPGQLRYIHNLIRKKRLTAYFAARQNLRTLRREAMAHAKQLRTLRTAFSKKDLSHHHKKMLCQKISKLAKMARHSHHFLTKTGALRVLGVNKRRWNKVKAARRSHNWGLKKIAHKKAIQAAWIEKQKAAGAWPPAKKQKMSNKKAAKKSAKKPAAKPTQKK